MPYDNAFRHQTYHAGPPSAPYVLVQPPPPIPPESPEFMARLSRAGNELRARDVGALILVHGTFMGNDITGWISQIEWFAPGLADQLRSGGKRLVDTLAGDIANYSDKYAEVLSQGINADCEADPIMVRRFQWSGQNRHLGRADAAVRLFAELQSLEIAPHRRILLWGHSHAGNVFALLTHLIGSTVESCRKFSRAIRKLYHQSRGGEPDPAWLIVSSELQKDPVRLTPPDIVTFGTPVRYGWETRGYHTLMHIVHHRPATALPWYQVAFPPNWEQVLAGMRGDFLQQFGVAGTNFAINPLSPRDWLVEARLRRLLQPTMRRRDTWQRLRCGMRVPDEGLTLLVDYHEGDSANASLLFGHGVYTRIAWMPFHLEQVLRLSLATPTHA